MALIILLRVVLSVSANALQKRLLLNRAGVQHTWILTYSIMLVPAILLAFARPKLTSPSFWTDILIGGVLDAVGNLAMVAALRSTDISIFGPLNALRPIIALLFGWFVLGEQPSSIGLIGVAITVLGGVVLFGGENGKKKGRFSDVWKPLFLRVTGLSLGVAGAVFLKRAAMVSSAEVTVAVWILCGLVCLVIVAAIRSPKDLRTLPPALSLHWRWLLVHSAVFISMQLLTIRIFQTTLLAYSFAFFQLGMLLQVFVGRIFFREKAFGRRLVAAIVMALGSALILWKG